MFHLRGREPLLWNHILIVIIADQVCLGHSSWWKVQQFQESPHSELVKPDARRRAEGWGRSSGFRICCQSQLRWVGWTSAPASPMGRI